MVLSVISPFVGAFDPFTRDKLDIAGVLQLAMFGKPQFPSGTALVTQGGAAFATEAALAKAQRRTAKVMLTDLMGRRAADFRGTVDTSNADALSSAVSLTTKGVTFPAATLRTIKLRMVSTNDAESIYQEIEQDVWGNDGVTPKLGDARLVKAFKIASGTYAAMGRIHYKGVLDVEDTNGMNSSGTALAAFSTGNAALTFPVSRAVKVIGTNCSGSDATLTNNRSIRVQAPAAAGTAAILTASEGATDALADPAATSIIEAELEIWPVAQCQLVLNVAAVEVHVRTTLADVYRHIVDVLVGPAQTNKLSA